MSTVFLSFTQRLRLYGNEDPSDGPSYTSTDIDLVKSFLFAAWLPRRHSDGCGRANTSRSRCALHFDIIVFLFLFVYVTVGLQVGPVSPLAILAGRLVENALMSIARHTLPTAAQLLLNDLPIRVTIKKHLVELKRRSGTSQ